MLEEGVSKPALIRHFVRNELHPLPSLDNGPLSSMVGVDDCESALIDDVSYG